MAKKSRRGSKRKPNKYIQFVMAWKKSNKAFVDKHGHIKATKGAAAAYRAEHGLKKSPKRKSKSRKSKSRKSRKSRR